MSQDRVFRIALVGHCGPDAFALQSAVAGFVSGAEVERITSPAELGDDVGRFDLLLVNRVLDGGFGGSSGLDLIRSFGADASRSMLISNYPESVQEAVDAGAARGFGKRAMRSEEARVALHDALGLSANNE